MITKRMIMAATIQIFYYRYDSIKNNIQYPVHEPVVIVKELADITKITTHGETVA